MASNAPHSTPQAVYLRELFVSTNGRCEFVLYEPQAGTGGLPFDISVRKGFSHALRTRFAWNLLTLVITIVQEALREVQFPIGSATPWCLLLGILLLACPSFTRLGLTDISKTCCGAYHFSTGKTPLLLCVTRLPGTPGRVASDIVNVNTRLFSGVGAMLAAFRSASNISTSSRRNFIKALLTD